MILLDWSVVTLLKKVIELSERLEYFKQLEKTMNRAIFSAETTSDEIKKVARQEAESLITVYDLIQIILYLFLIISSFNRIEISHLDTLLYYFITILPHYH